MLLDSWAWIELFEDAKNAGIIREEIAGRQAFTSVLNLAEVSVWCARNNKDSRPYLQAIKENSIILSLDWQIAEKAGSVLVELRKKSSGIGLIDAMIYSQAAANGMPVLTGDPHFINLPNVKFIQ